MNQAKTKHFLDIFWTLLKVVKKESKNIFILNTQKIFIPILI